MKETVGIQMKTHMAKIHRKNAEIFRDKAKKIEAIYSDETGSDIPVDDKKEHQAYVIGAIYSTIAYLDSWPREFISSLQDDQERSDEGKDPIKYPEIAETLRKDILKGSPLSSVDSPRPSRKLNKVLELAGKTEFENDKSPIAELDKLNRIRNKLTHHEPRWVQGGPKDYTEDEYGLEESLKDEFELNPLMPPGNAFFPSQCLSYGCAEWGLRHATSLVRGFKRKMGIEN